MTTLPKRNDWFVNYHTIGDKQGLRDLSYRVPFFDKEDFINKNVLDIGCNTGQMCKFAYSLGATYVLGVEYDNTAVINGNKLLTDDEKEKIEYITDDVDNYFFYSNLDKFDTTLLLSVIGTQELTNRYGMLANLSSNTNVLYYEGHTSSKYNELFENLIKYTNFSTIEYKGIQYDNKEFEKKKIGRHFFRCSKDKINSDDCFNKIQKLFTSDKRHIVALCGFGGTGKTTLLNKIINFLKANMNIEFNEPTNDGKVIISKSNEICIVDDLPINDDSIKQFKYVIFSDYKALTYLNNVNTIFYMNYNIKDRMKNRNDSTMRGHRTPTFNSNLLHNIENIYNILPYSDDNTLLDNK
jgi:SAM-dependent methyltransferase